MFHNILQRFVFFPDNIIHHTPDLYNIPFDNIYLTNPSHLSLFEKYHGWYIESPKNNSNPLHKYILLFFHGNAGNISTRLSFIKKMYLNNISILIFDYPGFGLSEGIPNEENCILCSLQFYNFLIHQKKYPPENIILYGESIGGCIASSLAQQIISPKLILQSTFSNIQNIIKKISNLPTFLYMSIGFNTKKNLQKRNKLKRINSNIKTLIIHSEEDELIPFEHGLELSKYSTHFYKCKGNHNSTVINSEFIQNIILFILEK